VRAAKRSDQARSSLARERVSETRDVYSRGNASAAGGPGAPSNVTASGKKQSAVAAARPLPLPLPPLALARPLVPRGRKNRKSADRQSAITENTAAVCGHPMHDGRRWPIAITETENGATLYPSFPLSLSISLSLSLSLAASHAETRG